MWRESLRAWRCNHTSLNNPLLPQPNLDIVHLVFELQERRFRCRKWNLCGNENEWIVIVHCWTVLMHRSYLTIVEPWPEPMYCVFLNCIVMHRYRSLLTLSKVHPARDRTAILSHERAMASWCILFLLVHLSVFCMLANDHVIGSAVGWGGISARYSSARLICCKLFRVSDCCNNLQEVQTGCAIAPPPISILYSYNWNNYLS